MVLKPFTHGVAKSLFTYDVFVILLYSTEYRLGQNQKLDLGGELFLGFLFKTEKLIKWAANF